MKIPNNFKVSNKHSIIDKANQQTIIAVSVAAALVVFAIISVNAIIGQLKYQQLVLDKRNEANKQLEVNYKEAQTLFSMFQAFDNAPESILGTSDKNSKIVLDALPSKYDFPALAVYMQNLIDLSDVSSEGFTGQDDEAAAIQESDAPEPIMIPVNFEATGSVASVRQFIDNLYRSVKPITIKTIELSGSDSSMTVSITGVTYYQPQKNYTTEQQVIKPTGSGKSSTNTQGSTEDASTTDPSMETNQ